MNLPKSIARPLLKLDKSSPKLLFGAGVVGVVGSTVLACRATLKLEEVLIEGQNRINQAKSLEHRAKAEDLDYTTKDRESDTRIIIIQTGAKIARLYAPAVVLGGASIAALAQSHNILTRRNAALTAAYAALEKGFAEYRQRVVDKYGEEEDRRLRYGSHEVTVHKEGGGKEEKVTRVAPGTPSIYARFFDPSSSNWNTEPEYNLIFLQCQQQYANDMLRARGHLFLNEVYDSLGIPRSEAGSVVGWIVDDGQTAEHFVDFGVWEKDDHNARDFVNGLEGAILLDFNVDGVIYNLIDTPVEKKSWRLKN